MEAVCDCDWVNQMAGTLVCEIIELMAGIQLQHHPAWEHTARERDIDAIYGFVEGDFPKYGNNDDFVDKDDEFKHSLWLSFMKNRLLIAKNLLNEKGVIYVRTGYI